ncbi:hypothetical protein CVT24_009506 [Panaeolus cyanescens]|uniref:RNA polymerase II assembly factor Rtp1 C-terminal domain-containing protein n=1 Tax=Panaeolus cyanescens TaxID=181874 RepID=A0A409VE76_9AGAR|nr:hypothetical protein CVT24_009506 [Panaeolus cyanescens]
MTSSSNSHPSSSYTDALRNGDFLLDSTQSSNSTGGPHDLISLLKGRLRTYYAHKYPAVGAVDIEGAVGGQDGGDIEGNGDIGRLERIRLDEEVERATKLEDVQVKIGQECLGVVREVHGALDVGVDENDDKQDDEKRKDSVEEKGRKDEGKEEGGVEQRVGVRDLKKIRTHLSIVFKWGIDPLLKRVGDGLLTTSNPSSSSRTTASSHVVEMDEQSSIAAYEKLCAITKTMMGMVFPDGFQGRIGETHVTSSMLRMHASDILLPLVLLGWMPRNLGMKSGMKPVDELRPLTLRLLRLMTPAQAILALGTIVASGPAAYVRKTCVFLLNKQMLRPDGVRGLCEAVFPGGMQDGEGGSSSVGGGGVGDEVRLEKLKQVAVTLTNVPPGVDANEYFEIIIPKILQLVSDRAPAAHRRAAAFTVFKILMPDNTTNTKDTQETFSSTSPVVSMLLHALHDPFLLSFDADDAISSSPQKVALQPIEALDTLSILLANTEPSPIFVSKLLSPIIPSLYLLSTDLASIKAADPHLKESVRGLIRTWGKIVDDDEVVRVLWDIVEGGRDTYWKVGLEGIVRVKGTREGETPSLVIPKKPEKGKGKLEEQDEEGDIDLNLFDFYPDPKHFVTMLRDLNRGDVASVVFVRLLEGYEGIKRVEFGDVDSMRALHLLQIVMQMQQQMFKDKSSPLLKNPERILVFISKVLGTTVSGYGGAGGSKAGVGGSKGGSLRHGVTDDPMHEAVGDEIDDELGDSDDEEVGASDMVAGPDDEMLETTITLLLSILEDDKLETKNYPLFNEIFSQLEPLAQNGSATIRPLAREARLVITARIAGETHTVKSGANTSGERDARETYQEALKLLQDPILPVRAHGLMLLRDLISSSSSEMKKTADALTPSILSIFIQSVQDDDSYIFLNAVQGLIVLAERVGERMVRVLMGEYVGFKGGKGGGGMAMSVMSEQDVNVKTRIGEALSAVIKGSGMALGKYVDLMVPPLMQLLRTHDCPIALRTSGLSLLADCVSTYPYAMLRYTSDLCWTLLDLLKLESNIHKPVSTKGESGDGKEKGKEQGSKEGQRASVEDDGNTEGDSEKEPPAPESLDTNPTSKNPKLAPFRRAALHLLMMILREALRVLYDDSTRDRGVVTSIVPRGFVGEVGGVLGMMGLWDEDGRTRVMARECAGAVDELKRGVLGL